MSNRERIIELLDEDLKSTYAFMPDGMYDSYVRKIELGKRGDFIECIKGFLENIGIEFIIWTMA